MQESHELETRIRRSLAGDRRLGKVAVSVDEFGVKLEGPVESYYARSLALSAVARVPGVQLVNDQISVRACLAR